LDRDAADGRVDVRAQNLLVAVVGLVGDIVRRPVAQPARGELGEGLAVRINEWANRMPGEDARGFRLRLLLGAAQGHEFGDALTGRRIAASVEFQAPRSLAAPR
jgi:hypothetical protein